MKTVKVLVAVLLVAGLVAAAAVPAWAIFGKNTGGGDAPVMTYPTWPGEKWTGPLTIYFQPEEVGETLETLSTVWNLYVVLSLRKGMERASFATNIILPTPDITDAQVEEAVWIYIDTEVIPELDGCTEEGCWAVKHVQWFETDDCTVQNCSLFEAMALTIAIH